MQDKSVRNRKRSKRREILCPRHDCPIDSVSKKFTLFADQAIQLQNRGVSRLNALTLIASRRTVSLSGEWVEAFWCDRCQKTEWYHVRKIESGVSHRANGYEVSSIPQELWKQVTGTIDPTGNASVGEFTKRQSRMVGFNGVKDFNFTS
jgi:hypothetical protein